MVPAVSNIVPVVMVRGGGGHFCTLPYHFDGVNAAAQLQDRVANMATDRAVCVPTHRVCREVPS